MILGGPIMAMALGHQVGKPADIPLIVDQPEVQGHLPLITEELMMPRIASSSCMVLASSESQAGAVLADDTGGGCGAHAAGRNRPVAEIEDHLEQRRCRSWCRRGDGQDQQMSVAVSWR